MSLRSTTTPSRAQTYCCFRRDPQAACSRLNEIADCACVAAYSLTGMDTMPKLTVTEDNARAAMMRSTGCGGGKPPGGRIVPKYWPSINQLGKTPWEMH